MACRLFGTLPAVKPNVNRDMAKVRIGSMKSDEVPALAAMFNRSCQINEIPYTQLSQDQFTDKLTGEGKHILVAREKDGVPVGFCAFSLVPGREPQAFLTLLLTGVRSQCHGVGTALLEAVMQRSAAFGAQSLRISPSAPVSLNWVLQRPAGLEHNCAPGVIEQNGYRWLMRRGFQDQACLVVMSRQLKRSGSAAEAEELRRAQAELEAQGIRVGKWTPDQSDSFDTLCDHVGSEYWRHVLSSELQAHRTGRPNADPALWPDGIEPAGPRTLLTAVADGRIVGFTGPIAVQQNGRGWFTGICVDPDYGCRGIGRLLFRLLLA